MRTTKLAAVTSVVAVVAKVRSRTGTRSSSRRRTTNTISSSSKLPSNSSNKRKYRSRSVTGTNKKRNEKGDGNIDNNDKDNNEKNDNLENRRRSTRINQSSCTTTKNDDRAVKHNKTRTRAMTKNRIKTKPKEAKRPRRSKEQKHAGRSNDTDNSDSSDDDNDNNGDGNDIVNQERFRSRTSTIINESTALKEATESSSSTTFVTPSPVSASEKIHKKTSSSSTTMDNNNKSIHKGLEGAASTLSSTKNNRFHQTNTTCQKCNTISIPSLICPYILNSKPTFSSTSPLSPSRSTALRSTTATATTNTPPKQYHNIHSHVQCACAYQYNHNSSKSLSEAYLASYAEEYHASLLETETRPIPVVNPAAVSVITTTDSGDNNTTPAIIEGQDVNDDLIMEEIAMELDINPSLSSSSSSDDSAVDSYNRTHSHADITSGNNDDTTSIGSTSSSLRSGNSDSCGDSTVRRSARLSKQYNPSNAGSTDNRKAKSITQHQLIRPKPSPSSSTTSKFSKSSTSSNSTVQYSPFEQQMNYIHRHEFLTAGTRSILIDWLIDVGAECELNAITLGCAVGLVDRCLAVCEYRQKVNLDGDDDNDESSISIVSASNASGSSSGSCDGMLVIGSNTLQLLGCGCMMISSKIHDINPMKGERFTYLSADSYNEAQIVEMEQNICSALRFHLQIVTPYNFIQRFLRASHVSGNLYHHNRHLLSSTSVSSNCPKGSCTSSPPPCSFSWEEEKIRFMVDYLLEIAMLEIEFVAMKPSLVAAGAIYLARATLDIRDKSPLSPKSSPSLSTPQSTSLSKKLIGKKCKSQQQNVKDEEGLSIEEQNQETYGYFSQTLTFYSGYSVKDLVNVVCLLHRAHEKNGDRSSTLSAVYDKYASDKYKSVALNVAAERNKLFPESFAEYYPSICSSSSEDDSDTDGSAN